MRRIQGGGAAGVRLNHGDGRIQQVRDDAALPACRA